jgi:hypothetical protein
MLIINDRLDKLAAVRVDFTERGMLKAPAARPPVAGPAPAAPAVDNDELGATDEPYILGEVKLAVTHGKQEQYFVSQIG